MPSLVPQTSTFNIPLIVQEVPLNVDTMYRPGMAEPIVFLHGFGSTKEDYADIALYPMFDGHSFLAWDAPGCGQTQCGDLSKVSIPFLVDTALAILDHVGCERFHLVGHSMGGLTALMLADRYPQRVLSFTNIEGNIASEDCFLSRQIDQFADDDAERFFDHFVERTRQAPAFSSALYATSLRHKVRTEAVRHIFRSMVDLSDDGDLMKRFLGLPCPKTFMYGEQNRYLSYLQHIQSHGVQLAEVPCCGHFPMYSNPVAMWRFIGATIGACSS